ncbi:MAG: aminopeptidase P family protein [bacterium]|nr:aminopeptidase P family protein [bacterium]
MNNFGKMIFASTEESADLLYATGFMAPDPYIFFEANESKYIVVTALEYERAKKQSKNDVKVLERDEILDHDVEKSAENVLLSVTKKYPCKTWCIPKTFPFFYAEFLKKNGVEIECKNEEFFPSRRTKTKSEVKYINDAMRMTESGMLRAENIIREATIDSDGNLIYNNEKLTSEFLIKAINLDIVANGGFASETIASSGVQSSIPHETGYGVIKQGVPIIVDIFPKVEATGYHGDMTRTFVKGKACETLKNAYNAVKKARDYAKKNISAGIIPDILQNEIINMLDDDGFKTGKKDGSYFGFFHGLGHGVGLEVHELPRCGSLVTEPLKAGDIVTVEPGVYYSDWGGVRLEDILLVTENGNECITQYPDMLEID